MKNLILALRRIADQYALKRACDGISFDDWDESKHPRGNSKNAGQFAKKRQDVQGGGSGGEKQGEGREGGSANAEYRNPHITPEQDIAYVQAVSSGNHTRALKMLREAALRSMPNTKVPNVVWHNTKKKFNTFNSITGTNFFAKDRKWADRFGSEERYSNADNTRPYIINITNPMDMRSDRTAGEWLKFFSDGKVHLSSQGKAKLERFASEHPNDRLPGFALINHDISSRYGGTGYRESMIASGYDGCIFEDIARGPHDRTTYGVFSPSQIKSADITYDDQGKAIPLFERFNPNSDDIRF